MKAKLNSMEGDGISLHHSFYKDLHKNAYYINTYYALQSFLYNRDDKINHYDFVEFLMQINYDHINRLKIKEDSTAKRLLPDDWSYYGDNVSTMNYTLMSNFRVHRQWKLPI